MASAAFRKRAAVAKADRRALERMSGTVLAFTEHEGFPAHGAAITARLVPGGYYVFVCEACDGEGWEQTPANRFRHSEAYLRTEAAKAGLDFVSIAPCSIRNEGGTPVPSWAVALRKPPSQEP